jgi:CDP-alcohol phosphatidyltransferase-like enzyme
MPSEIKSSLKSQDVEEAIDLWFYRPVGYQIARASRRLRLHPNHVTIGSLLLGALSGHLFFYRSFTINLLGVFVFLAGDLLDSADGQLARMTNTTSKWGRILDGVADTVRFSSIYLHLALRLWLQSGQVGMILLATLAGMSHRIQAALTEYYRTAYQRYTEQPCKERMDQAGQVEHELSELRRKREPWSQRILLWFYIPYLRLVEAYSPSVLPLLRHIESRYPTEIPRAFSEEWRRVNRPLLSFYTMLGTNVRIAVLFTSVLLDRVPIYFLFEFVVLNIVAWRVLTAQGERNTHLMRWIDTHTTATSPG